MTENSRRLRPNASTIEAFEGDNELDFVRNVRRKSVDMTASYVVPDPTEGCNSEPTTQLDLDAYIDSALSYEYNFTALDFGLCTDSIQDSDGNCPLSPSDAIQVKGDITFKTSMEVTLAKQECLYQKYVLPLGEDSFNIRRNKWVKVVKGWGVLAKRILKIIPQFRITQKSNVDVIYTGVASSAIDTALTIDYGIKGVSYGVQNILTSPVTSFDLGTIESNVDAKADITGNLDFQIHLIPNIEFTLDAAGQLELAWKADLQLTQFGFIKAGSPDPLVPLDVNFTMYTVGAQLVCYESLFVETGLFGAVLGEIVDQDYENQEFCRAQPEYLFAMPLNHSNRGVGIGEYGENQYLITEYRYLDPPLNPIDWSTAEYGIMLLNGEMISYPMRVEAPYFHSEHAQTGWNNMIIPVWTQWPVPNDVVPPNYVMDTGGGQKFWLRVETAVGRYYLYLSDWTYFN